MGERVEVGVLGAGVPAVQVDELFKPTLLTNERLPEVAEQVRQVFEGRTLAVKSSGDDGRVKIWAGLAFRGVAATRAAEQTREAKTGRLVLYLFGVELNVFPKNNPMVEWLGPTTLRITHPLEPKSIYDPFKEVIITAL